MIRVFLLIVSLSLGACGFTPLYATRDDNRAAADLSRVTIASIPDMAGQSLRNALMDRFYPNGRVRAADYDLMIEPLVETITDLDITPDDETTRRSLRLATTMRVRDRASQKIIINRPLYALVSFNVLQSQFTTRVAEQNARENAVEDLARQIEAVMVTQGVNE